MIVFRIMPKGVLPSGHTGKNEPNCGDAYSRMTLNEYGDVIFERIFWILTVSTILHRNDSAFAFLLPAEPVPDRITASHHHKQKVSSDIYRDQMGLHHGVDRQYRKHHETAGIPALIKFPEEYKLRRQIEDTRHDSIAVE